MGAPGRLQGHGREAIGAVARRRGRGGHGFRREAIHLAHEKKYSEGHDQKINNRVQEKAVIDRRRAGRFGRGNRVVMHAVQAQKQI